MTHPTSCPHSLDRTVERIRCGVDEAGLEAPVLVGHSVSGGLVSVYAGQHPSRGVVNIDAAPDIAPFARLLQSLAGQIRGPAVPQRLGDDRSATGGPTCWRERPGPSSRATVTRGRTSSLSVSAGPAHRGPREAAQSVNDAMRRVTAAQVPYLLITGAELAARHGCAAVCEWLRWPGSRSGRTPATSRTWRYPRRFAALLAATARWQAGVPAM